MTHRGTRSRKCKTPEPSRSSSVFPRKTQQTHFTLNTRVDYQHTAHKLNALSLGALHIGGGNLLVGTTPRSGPRKLAGLGALTVHGVRFVVHKLEQLHKQERK